MISESNAKGRGQFWKDGEIFQIHALLDMLILKQKPCGFRSFVLDYMKFKPFVSLVSGLEFPYPVLHFGKS